MGAEAQVPMTLRYHLDEQVAAQLAVEDLAQCIWELCREVQDVDSPGFWEGQRELLGEGLDSVGHFLCDFHLQGSGASSGTSHPGTWLCSEGLWEEAGGDRPGGRVQLPSEPHKTASGPAGLHRVALCPDRPTGLLLVCHTQALPLEGDTDPVPTLYKLISDCTGHCPPLSEVPAKSGSTVAPH